MNLVVGGLTLAVRLGLLGPATVSPAEAETELSGPAYAEQLSTLPSDEQSEAEAAALFTEGKTLFDDARYEDAIELWVEAYRLAPRENILSSLGAAHRSIYDERGDARHLRWAILRYTQYLQEAGLEGEHFASVTEHLTRLNADAQLMSLRQEARVATRIFITTTAENAWMRLDDEPARPAAGAYTVQPGRHTVTVGGPGYESQAHELILEKGTTERLAVTLVPRPARIELTGDAGSRVEIDGASRGQLPLPGELAVKPGRHFIAVTRRGHVPFTRELDLGRDSAVALKAVTPPSKQRISSYVLMGVAGASLAASAVLTGLTFASQRKAVDLERRRESESLTVDQYQRYLAHQKDRDQFRAAAIGTVAVGGTLLTTGLVLFVFDRPEVQPRVLERERPRPEPKTLSLAPVLGPATAGASAHLTF